MFSNIFVIFLSANLDTLLVKCDFDEPLSDNYDFLFDGCRFFFMISHIYNL